MEPTVFELSLQAVHDAMTLAGPDAAGGYMRSSDPSQHMSAERLRLARAVMKRLPPNTNAGTAEDVAVKLCPFVAATVAR